MNNIIKKNIQKKHQEFISKYIKLKTFYLVQVSNIDYDIDINTDNDDLSPEFEFILEHDQIDINERFNEKSILMFINMIVENKISDKTGLCYHSCDISIQKFSPEEGITTLL